MYRVALFDALLQKSVERLAQLHTHHIFHRDITRLFFGALDVAL